MPRDLPARRRSFTPRTREIVVVAREIVERDGYPALSMRSLARRLGIRAPALYKHFADKREIELILIEDGLWERGDRYLAAAEGASDPIGAIADAHRSWALEHPDLYRLTYGAPLEDRINPDAQMHSGRALFDATAHVPGLAGAIWSFVHGMVELELLGRLPSCEDHEAIWRTGLDALRAALARA